MVHGVAWCYTVLRSVLGCYIVLHCVTRCYMVLQSFTRCYRMLHGLTRCSGCYVMLQGVSVIGFYTVLEGVDVTDKPLVSGRTAVDLIQVLCQMPAGSWMW